MTFSNETRMSKINSRMDFLYFMAGNSFHSNPIQMCVFFELQHYQNYCFILLSIALHTFHFKLNLE